MKTIVKRISIILLLVIISFLSSCDSFIDNVSDHDTADEKMDLLIKCLETEDIEGFKKLCASEQMEQSSTYDTDVLDLFAYYEGYYISKVGSVSTSEYSNWDCSYKDLGISYDVTTSIRTYRFAIGWRLQDSRADSYVGIHYLYVLKYEDDEYPDIGYGGDGLWTLGIHVDVHQNPPRD